MKRPDFFTLKNGKKIKLPFTEQEYKTRLENLRIVMSNNNLDVKKAVNQLFVNKYGVIGATLRKLSGSDTIDKQVIDGSIDDLMVPLTKKGRPDMRFKVNKKAKPFKPMKDNFKGKKARGYASNIDQANIFE